jgi:uncharacterized protein YndB with AHSA1/START domain
MPVRSITKDPKTLTMTVVSDFAAPIERVWAAWADPRQLERFWGPPGWPATFTEHSLVAGGKAAYYMTGPDGTKSYGWWRILRVDAPRSFEMEDGFADETGEPSQDMPEMRMRVSLEAVESGTRMTSVRTFPSVEAMERLLGMGMEEGLKAALGQLDQVLVS